MMLYNQKGFISHCKSKKCDNDWFINEKELS